MTALPLLLPLTWIASETSNVKRDEVVKLFPTSARYLANEEAWEVPIHGWIYETEPYPQSIVDILGTIEIDTEWTDGIRLDRLADRTAGFMVDNERGKRIRIRLCERVFELPPSGSNGHFNGTLRISDAIAKEHRIAEIEEPDRLEFSVILPEHDPRIFSGHTFLVEPTGLGIISDIDDTIKVSNVSDRKELLMNTFLRRFRAVPGMSRKYRDWARRDGTVFFYVSGSPWQLYTALSEFMFREGFPVGAFHLRSVRVKDPSVLAMFGSPAEYKVHSIESILARYPKRCFVLVGDSGEKDPEAYGELARRHPEQVLIILIRDVTDESESDPRYRDAFADVPESKWKTFRDVAEIVDAVPPPDDSR